jgi:hypothetical protein
MTKFRPILHVHVTDDLTGKLLADIDSPSTASALAYFLCSRRIDETATEGSVVDHVLAGSRRRNHGGSEPIIFEQRDPISRVLERALYVHVEGTGNCAACRLINMGVVV